MRDRCIAGAASIALALAFGAWTAPAEAEAKAPLAEHLFHPELIDALTDFERARGGEAYAALRRIWGTWQEADPDQVEEFLALAAQSRKHAAPVRAYGELLGAFARVRRGDLAGAKAKVDGLGFVDRWLIVGPFDNEGKAGLEREFGPEAELDQPIVPGRAFSGKERPVRFRPIPDAFHYGWVDTGVMLRPEQKVCAYATTFISEGPADPESPATGQAQARDRNITLFAGVSGGFKLWFNGELVLEDDAYRGYDAGRSSTTVRLRPGVNRLLLKACGDGAAPVFSVRLADAQGEADERIVTSDDIRLSEAAIANFQEAQSDQRPPPKHPASLNGPLQDFASKVAVVEDASPDDDQEGARFRGKAGDLEAYASYLLLTSGDDPTKHLARDLARTAAEQEPTVERLLLAARLSENRNQARRFIEQAEALAGSDDVDVLLARAAHERSGPNPRLAFPFYDRVLDIDPDDIRALRGRVELYNAAGLRRTALSLLERALARSPHSVILLNMVASQRSALGRSTDAAEAEDRYAARRYDDTSWLSGQLDLSLARRHESAADHWLARILDSEPQSLWAHNLASKTHRLLGREDRALSSLQRGLELAPEDVGVLRSLADLQGELGRRDEQMRLMERDLRIRPQDRDVREYVEHMAPPEQKLDEAYAMAPEEFLPLRNAPAAGHHRRTLRDLTVSTVYANGLASQFRQVVFQPLTDAAAASARQYAFHYQADRQIVQLKGARVFRGDGTTDEAIESGEGAADDPSISMYTSGRTFYVQFPRLETGDVVELRYRIDDVTPRNEFADYFGDIAYLQSDEPVQNAEYVLVTPKSRKIYIDQQMKGLERSVHDAGDQRIYRFFADEVPAITPEPSMPPWPEVLGFVHVSTYESYDDLGRWYWGLVQDQFDLDQETRELAREITKDAKTDLEKVQAVYNWVVKNTRYVALEFGIYGFKPRRCVQTVARGWGDCKDKATVIVTLLKEVGVDARMVVLRTQMRGDFPSKLPSLAPFDHAIAYVPSLDLYLDGTADYTGSTELPVMDQGALGLHVAEGVTKLVKLPPPDPKANVIRRDVDARLAADGSAQVTLAYETKGHAASSWRRRYSADSTRKQRLARDVGSSMPGFEIDEGGVETNELSQLEQPVTMKIRGKTPSFARREGDLLSMRATVSAGLTSSYASLSKRQQDVRISGFSTMDDTYRVKLPPGSRVVSGPQPVDVKSRFGAYTIEVEQQGDTIVVHSRLSLSVDRVKPADYAEWKKFCAAADQALTRRLVIDP